MNDTLNRDKLLTNRAHFGSLAIKKQLVLNTWSGTLLDEDSLPDDWIKSKGVLVGIRPVTRKNGVVPVSTSCTSCSYHFAHPIAIHYNSQSNPIRTPDSGYYSSLSNSALPSTPFSHSHAFPIASPISPLDTRGYNSYQPDFSGLVQAVLSDNKDASDDDDDDGDTHSHIHGPELLLQQYCGEDQGRGQAEAAPNNCWRLECNIRSGKGTEDGPRTDGPAIRSCETGVGRVVDQFQMTSASEVDLLASSVIHLLHKFYSVFIPHESKINFTFHSFRSSILFALNPDSFPQNKFNLILLFYMYANLVTKPIPQCHDLLGPGATRPEWDSGSNSGGLGSPPPQGKPNSWKLKKTTKATKRELVVRPRHIGRVMCALVLGGNTHL
ncbi:hypothetical protein C8J57DRAFT_1244659 [Mycena rebaudengoi]|nr:hypothetical protein C8J57DRAFT_1244659 [Mycena rebaudengoi]